MVYGRAYVHRTGLDRSECRLGTTKAGGIRLIIPLEPGLPVCQNALLQAKINSGMSYWDNAIAESFFGTVKTEFIHSTTFLARTAIVEWIEVFYNRQRLHPTIRFLFPSQLENNFTSLYNHLSPLKFPVHFFRVRSFSLGHKSLDNSTMPRRRKTYHNLFLLTF